MIELTEEQVQAIAEQGTPLVVWNSKTKESFVLVRSDESHSDKGELGQEQAANQRMLDALAQVERIQATMHPKAGDGSEDFLRQARSGEMYESGSDD